MSPEVWRVGKEYEYRGFRQHKYVESVFYVTLTAKVK